MAEDTIQNGINQRFPLVVEALKKERLVTTQREVCQALEVSESFPSDMKKGKSSLTADLIVRLNQIWGVALDFVLLGEGPVFSKPSEIGGNSEKIGQSEEDLIVESENVGPASPTVVSVLVKQVKELTIDKNRYWNLYQDELETRREMQRRLRASAIPS